MRNTLLLALILLLGTTFASNGRQISADEAREIASEFFNTGTSASKRNLRQANTYPAHSTDSPGNASYYVFNEADNNGFIIVSADSRARTILAYSDHGNIDFDNMPPQLADLLNGYETQIRAIRDSDSAGDGEPRYNLSSVDQVVLETAHYHQGYPYNAKTPLFDGFHAPTGCSATAMAIVMKYHNWPPKSVGSYYWGGYLEQIPHDFNIKYDWDNILDSYTGEETPEQIDAIATLMLEAGISVDTQYGLYESGAWATMYGTFALKDRFRFHPMCRQLDWYLTSYGVNEDPYYSFDEWASMIRAEIDANRPVIYSAGIVNGHMFVCDGYDNNNLFHFNFGWGGSSDGFYSLTAILPDDQGYSPFTDSHTMIIGLKPEESDSETAPIVYIDSNAPGAGLYIFTDEVRTNEPFGISLQSLAYRAGSVELGCALTDGKGHIKQVMKNDTGTRREWTGIVTEPVEPEDMLVAVYREVGSTDWIEIPGWDGNNKCSVHNTDFYQPLTLKLNGLPLIIRVHDNDNYITNTYTQDETITVKKGLSYEMIFLCPDEQSNYRMEINGVRQNLLLYADGISSSLKGWYLSGKLIPDGECNELTVTRIPHSSLEDIEVFCAQEGTLESALQDKDLSTIGQLHISGKINNKDFGFAINNLPNLYNFDAFNATLEDSYFGYSDRPSIGSSTYYNQNTTLHSISLPHGVSWLSDISLRYAPRLAQVLIPESVSEIGNGAFHGDIALKTWYCFNPEPPAVENDFSSTPFWDATLYVPFGSKEKYLEHSIWKKFKNIIEFDPAGLGSVLVDTSSDSSVSVYNIQGVREYTGTNIDYARLGKGIHLLVKGNTVSKIYVK